MEQEQRQQVKKYIELIARRKKLIISCVLAALFVGLGVYLNMPKVYSSTAMLIYEEAKVNPANKLSPEMQAKTLEMVATLTQQVTSRTSLEAIIKQFDLYQELRQNLPMEDVVELMRKKHITVQPPQDKGAVFRVSFNGSEPKKVMQVTNALAARFIEENLRYREERATETSAYVGDELTLAKSTMDKKEAAMRDYKLKYYNEMPQQFAANSARLIALQTQMQKNRDSAQDLERTKVLIQEQITLRKETLTQMGLASSLQSKVGKMPNTASVAVLPQLAELNQARQQLADLQMRYTESHPEVRRMQKKVTSLEEVAAGLGAPASEDLGSTSGPPIPRGEMRDAQIDQLLVQFKKADMDISSLNRENEELKKQIAQYEQWLSMAPVREAEWNALTRDYDQLKAHYEQLVSRNLEAGSVESLERRQKGSQFKIVDSAYLPEKPTQPDFQRIMLLALAIGLGLGGGIVLLLEVQDTSFRDVADIEATLGLPVICAIARIKNENDIRGERRWSRIWWAVLAMTLLLLLGAMAYLYKSGRIII